MLLFLAFQLKNVHLKKVAMARVQRIRDLAQRLVRRRRFRTEAVIVERFLHANRKPPASSHRKNAGFSLCVVDPH
jgi:hypothetical protein